MTVHHPSADWTACVDRAYRAVTELRIEGVATNRALLLGLLKDARFRANDVDTTFVETRLPALLERSDTHPVRHAPVSVRTLAGAPVDAGAEVPDGAIVLRAPLAGTVIAHTAAAGDVLAKSPPVLTLEAMKMEHPVAAAEAGMLIDVIAATGAPVARHRSKGRRTARENLDDLFDGGSFVEYGGLLLAGRCSRHTLDELIERTPADRIIAGIGTINAATAREDGGRAAAFAYDYTVLAGTQGLMGHRKTDRFLDVVKRRKLPLICFTEGGGGRPGDTDLRQAAGLEIPTFHRFGELSGHVPVIAVNAGFCFAGNAAILGCCDTVIATEDSSIGMSGPSMIEGGGLGEHRPEDVGPARELAACGVIDLLVADNRSGGAGQALSRLFPGTARRLVLRRSAPPAPCGSGKPPARLRHAPRTGIGGRHRIGP